MKGIIGNVFLFDINLNKSIDVLARMLTIVHKNKFIWVN